MSAYDIFDAMVGNDIAADGVIRSASLKFAADDSQRLPPRGGEREKEAMRLSHLGRKERRNGRPWTV